MILNLQKGNSGYSLIELMAALIIAAPAFTALIILAKSTNRSVQTLKLEYQASYRLSKAQQMLEQIISDTDTHHLLLLPRTHKNGRITYTDGSPNPISASRTSTRPDGRSSAISTAALDVSGTLRVKTNSTNGRDVIVKACQRYPNPKPKTAHSLLAVSTDGLFEVTTNRSTFRLRYPCSELNLRFGRSMITKRSSATDLALTQYLIPITKLYTLYLDRKNSLRYLAHSGARNIENQPIVRGITTLKADTSLVQPGPLLDLKASASTEKRVLYIEKIGALIKTPGLNFTLNRP